MNTLKNYNPYATSIILYSRKQAQEILGIGKNHMLNLLQNGQIKAFRIGKRGDYKIRKEDLEEFIENRMYY